MKLDIKLLNYNWNIQIYYTINDKDIQDIKIYLQDCDCSREIKESILKNLENKYLDTGFAYSNYKLNRSIIVIHKASSIGEFINTFEHEKNHLLMHICEALDINPYSEEAAHLNGDLSLKILEEALYTIVEL